MYFITSFLNSITMPIRSIYSWFTRYTPGLKSLPNISPAMRMALMTFLFLIVVYVAAVVSFWFSDASEKPLWIWAAVLVLAFVIPVIVFYLVKFWMIEDESKYPDIDRVWAAAMEDCERNGIYLTEVPLFLVQGARDQREATQIMKATQLPMTVTVPAQENADIGIFANSDAIFLYLNGCSCISRLSSAPTGPSAFGTGHASPVGGGPPTGTIDAAMFSAQSAAPPAADDVGQTLTEAALAAPPSGTMAGGMQPAAEGVGGTMLLPEGQGIGDFLGNSGRPAADAPRVPQLSSQDIFDREQKLRYVCKLITEGRKTLCPINGIITLLPFDLVESASSQIQTAAQKDTAILREELMVRCSNTVLITQLEREDGFQELIKRVGTERTREFRFGKGCELWNAPEARRLDATAAHAVGAFEDWIYMLFQEENALKHRYNSRLFMLLCRIRGKFAENLRAVLSRGFGFDPLTEGHLAYEQFLFGGCYFAAAGGDSTRQAFIKSVFLKGIQQEGELEWAPEARRRDQQYQLAANLFALLGTISFVAIVGMLVWKFGISPGDS